MKFALYLTVGLTAHLCSGAPTVTERGIPVSDGFDFPVGPPDAKGYYDAQSFGKNRHLGSDWNGVGGGNTRVEVQVASGTPPSEW